MLQSVMWITQFPHVFMFLMKEISRLTCAVHISNTVHVFEFFKIHRCIVILSIWIVFCILNATVKYKTHYVYTGYIQFCIMTVSKYFTQHSR